MSESVRCVCRSTDGSLASHLLTVLSHWCGKKVSLEITVQSIQQMANSMHRTTSQVWKTGKVSGKPEDVAGRLVCVPECALTLKKHAFRRSVSQNATICLVPHDSDAFIWVALRFLVLLRSIRSESGRMTILAAMLLVGSEPCWVRCQIFTKVFLSMTNVLSSLR